MNNGLFAPPNGGMNQQQPMPIQQQPNMPTVPPEGMSPQQAEVDALDALSAEQQKPKYSVGDPHLDKYINMFLGA